MSESVRELFAEFAVVAKHEVAAMREDVKMLAQDARWLVGEFRDMYAEAREKERFDDIHPVLYPVVLLIVATILLIILFVVYEVPDGDGTRGGNPPPEISPIKKMELLMPIRVGQHSTLATWPPFWGHTFPLGDRR